MKLEILQEGVASEVDLRDGAFTLGGSETDQIRVDGLPSGALKLRVRGEALIAEAADAIAVDDVLCPTGVSRLVLAGEIIALASGVRVRQLSGGSSAAPETNALVRELLAGGDPARTTAACLVCLTGLDLGRRFPLAPGANSVGRGAQADVRIRDRNVSRRHARIVREGKGARVVDLETRNGTFVNGARLGGSRRLRDGDVLEIGRTLLKYSAPDVEPARRGAPPGGTAAQGPKTLAAAGAPESAAPVESHEEREAPEWAVIAAGIALAIAGAVATLALR